MLLGTRFAKENDMNSIIVQRDCDRCEITNAKKSTLHFALEKTRARARDPNYPPKKKKPKSNFLKIIN